MEILAFVIVAFACFCVGFNLGYIKGAFDFQKIIDIYKKIIEDYSKAFRETKP